jgi:hypothetical protein
MPRNLHLHLPWLGAAALAFLAGTWLGTTRTSPSAKSSPTHIRRPAISEQGPQSPPSRPAASDPSVPPPISDDDIHALATRAFRNSNPIDGARAFSDLLTKLTPVTAEILAREFIDNSGSVVPGSQRRAFHYAWGIIDGRGAVQYALDNLGGESLGLLIDQVLPGWGAADPSAGLAWLDGPGPAALAASLQRSDTDPDRFGTMLESSRPEFFGGIADRSLAMAVEYALQPSNTDHAESCLREISERALIQLGPSGAAAWADNLPDGGPKGSALATIAPSFCSENREGAIQWLETYADAIWATPALDIVRERFDLFPPESP